MHALKSQGEIEAAVCDAVSRFQQEVVAGKTLLETLVRDATGKQPVSVHHDISPTTGEEVLVFTLSAAPQCRDRNGFQDRRRK